MITTLYAAGVIITGIVFGLGCSVYILYRIGKCFMTYAAGSDLDDFDDSVIIECGINTGTNPGGITTDAIIGALLCAIIALAWPVAVPIVILFILAKFMRKRAIAQQDVVDALRG